jgi:hypothetical protein
MGTRSEQSKRRRKKSRIHRRDDEQDEREAKRRNLGKEEEEEEEEEEVVSSAPSSPICEPYIPDDEEYSVELYEAFEEAEKHFQEKIGSFPITSSSSPIRQFQTSIKLSTALVLWL